MIPCLYTETETAFTTNGIGKLCDTLSCYVTEKRNGSYELKMTYSASGLHAEDLVEGNIILAKPSERATYQPFRIYKITTGADLDRFRGILGMDMLHAAVRVIFED